MNSIVHNSFLVADLPETLREGLPADALVRVIIEVERPAPEHVPTLKELLAMRRPPYRTIEEIVEEVRCDRDSWDD